MLISTNSCVCCDADVHTITIPNELVNFDGETFVLTLDDEELMDLYQTCKSVTCQ